MKYKAQFILLWFVRSGSCFQAVKCLNLSVMQILHTLTPHPPNIPSPPLRYIPDKRPPKPDYGAQGSCQELIRGFLWQATWIEVVVPIDRFNDKSCKVAFSPEVWCHSKYTPQQRLSQQTLPLVVLSVGWLVSFILTIIPCDLCVGKGFLANGA